MDYFSCKAWQPCLVIREQKKQKKESDSTSSLSTLKFYGNAENRFTVPSYLSLPLHLSGYDTIKSGPADPPTVLVGRPG